MKDYKFIAESLQAQAINLLKQLGADKDSLWLVEVSSIPTAKKFYPDRTIDDLTSVKAESDDSIIYYHESGSIHSHETFNSDDPISFAAAVAEVAVDLGGGQR